MVDELVEALHAEQLRLFGGGDGIEIAALSNRQLQCRSRCSQARSYMTGCSRWPPHTLFTPQTVQAISSSKSGLRALSGATPR
jgi:hypothetical protein